MFVKGWHFGSDNGTGTSGESLVVWSPIHNLLYKGYELLSRTEFVYEANLDFFLGVLSSFFARSDYSLEMFLVIKIAGVAHQLST